MSLTPSGNTGRRPGIRDSCATPEPRSFSKRLGSGPAALSRRGTGIATSAASSAPTNIIRISKTTPLQFAGFSALEEIDLADYVGRSVPMDVVLGRERTGRSQVIKQADVVALLALLPEEFVAGTGADNFRYYEPRCSHGSSLSPAHRPLRPP